MRRTRKSINQINVVPYIDVMLVLLVIFMVATPMMTQYRELKRRFPDHLLLFRLGDFYELFAEDAELGARLLHWLHRNSRSGARRKVCRQLAHQARRQSHTCRSNAAQRRSAGTRRCRRTRASASPTARRTPSPRRISPNSI